MVSAKSYRKSDCDVVRYKDLSLTFYDQKMVDGDGREDPLISGSDPWDCPPLDTIERNYLDLLKGYSQIYSTVTD
mgnify:CR=1 FL=1